jgi:translation initiation factor IF-3
VLLIATKELQINEEIRDKEVRVITDDGEQLGVMSASDAIKAAQYRSLDLVKIAPQAQPPVCKIMDYGKYKFDRQKREKEARKNQKVVEIKEVQLSLNIDTHDLETKVNHAIRFLKSGNKVKVSIRFRGREMVHPERGYEIMQSFADACSEYGTIEKAAKLENRNMLMFLAAKAAK